MFCALLYLFIGAWTLLSRFAARLVRSLFVRSHLILVVPTYDNQLRRDNFSDPSELRQDTVGAHPSDPMFLPSI
jgi:hypothetical protein